SRFCINADCSSKDVMREWIREISSSRCWPCAAISLSNWLAISETFADTAAMSPPPDLSVSAVFDSKAVTISCKFTRAAFCLSSSLSWSLIKAS
ncbi:hypothetical protein OAJ44_04770, partial [Chloroflexi bacterium]|nr:hypothetical protein [Chloroflexota bacterium]